MNMADCWIIMGHAMAGRSTTTAVRPNYYSDAGGQYRAGFFTNVI